MDEEFIMGRIISFRLIDWKDIQTRTTHFIQFFTKGRICKKMGYLNAKSKFRFKSKKESLNFSFNLPRFKLLQKN